jgi:hypothetical protein
LSSPYRFVHKVPIWLDLVHFPLRNALLGSLFLYILQTEAPRGGGGKGGGGYKESGLHVLYLLANSIVCLKGSGDRVDSGSRSALQASVAPAQVGSAATQPIMLLDSNDQNTQRVPSTSASSAPAPGWAGSSGGPGVGREAAFTADELAAIRALALSDLAFPLLVHSLCPTIYGHELVKAGLLMGLFGGAAYKSRPASVGSAVTAGREHERDAQALFAKEFQVRSDIHVLVVGDPGLGKVRIRNKARLIIDG